MKRYFTFWFLIIFGEASAQNFTKGSVFNHNVGDTIVEQYQEILLMNSTAPPIVTQRVFTKKVVSPAQDTIFYDEQITINQLQTGGMNFIMGYTNTSASYFITNLQSSIITYTFSNLQPCQFQSDTSYVDGCKQNVHVKETQQTTNTGCFEPSYWKRTYIEKAGLYQRYACGNCLPRGLVTVTSLIYSSANRCGTPVAIINGLNATSSDKSTLTVYPNPSTGLYYFTSPNYGSLSMADYLGKPVMNAPVFPGLNTISLIKESAGIYFLTVDMDGRRSSQKIIKQ